MDWDLKNVNHIKIKWISFISSEKGFNLLSSHPFLLQENYEKNTGEWKYVVLVEGKGWSWTLPYITATFFSDSSLDFWLYFLIRLFIHLGHLLQVLLPGEGCSDLPTLCYRCLPSIIFAFCLFKILSVLPSWPSQIAASVWLDNNSYKKYHLSAAVPLQGHFTKEMSFYVHTVNG